MKAKILKINEIEQKTSAVGHPYTQRDLVLGWQEDRDGGRWQKTQQVLLKLYGQEIEQFDARELSEGDEVEVEIDLCMLPSKRDGRLYNSVDVKLTPTN